MTDLHQLAANIAAHLPGWRAKGQQDYDHLAYILGANDMRLYITQARERGKLYIGTSWPDLHSHSSHRGRASDYNGARLSISHIKVSISRNPAAIAADIARRLLPQYVTYYHLARQQRDQAQQESKQLLQQASLLKSVCPFVQIDETLYSRAYISSLTVEAYGGFQRPGGRVQLFHNYGIRMDLSGLSIDQAVRIMAIIAEDQTCKNPTPA